MQKYQRIEPLLMKAWQKATENIDHQAMHNLRVIALERPKVPQHMKDWLTAYTLTK